jgi:hypothetical protein
MNDLFDNIDDLADEILETDSRLSEMIKNSVRVEREKE